MIHDGAEGGAGATPLASRRELLRTLGRALVAVPLASLLACDDRDAAAADAPPGGPSSDTAPPDAAPPDAAPPETPSGDADPGGWATGGTAAMRGGYPDPFAAGPGAVCALTCAATLGPCYADTIERRDVSEGLPGLPVRLAFLVVDDACRPVEGAAVDLWHTNPQGRYTGADALDLCTLNDPAAQASRAFRGVQRTNAAGRADFDTCFPGWYAGRTIHIHFTVRVGGVAAVTSQLYFDDALTDEILSTQPVYRDRGPRDTTNRTDGLIGAGALPDYTFHAQRLPDGALLAWKTLVLRSAPGTPGCRVPGGGSGV
jgi:protocatechuate 3,4-dioxygenase beta subunit